jgi:hypothetical protein
VCDGFAPELRQVTGARRFSQAISEGDGISIVVPVDDPGRARAAEDECAEALALHAAVEAVRDATSLPLLWRPHGSPQDARAAGADACVLAVAGLEEENGRLESLYREAVDLGLERALDLLQDVPAGKLAIAELPVSGRDEVAELERAGMDAVIVPAGNVAELVGGSAPEV